MVPALVALLAWSPSALACGGFFCNNSAPVDQSGERIVFAVNSAAGTVDAHVQIAYTGPSEDFAWIVPIASEPELFLSTGELFSQLGMATRPTFNLTWDEWGDCGGDRWGGWGVDYDLAGSADTASPANEGGVTVVNRTQVGPYDAVVLQATSSTELITWLQDHAYDLPSTLDTVLAPYVAQNQYFLALRLLKDRDAGDIAPIGFRYAGTQPSIPIQLTSVAATPDMPLEVYVFAENRAVPENYLHVQINEAAIDWLTNGANYAQVVTLAADQAGGHAFATDFSGPTTGFRGMLYSPGRYDTSAFAGATSPQDVMDIIQSQGFNPSPTLLNVLQSYMPPPAGVEAQDFYNCPSCYDTTGMDIDYAALGEALQTNVVAPLEAAEALFTDYPTLSRLTSSLSPLEMTVDPIFVQNADMGPVSNVHDATMVVDCRGSDDWYSATRRLILADGRVVWIPSTEWFDQNGTSSTEYMAGTTDTYAQLIEQAGASGEAEVIVDNTQTAADQLQEYNDDMRRSTRGFLGCSTQGSAGTGLGLIALLLLSLRRRR